MLETRGSRLAVRQAEESSPVPSLGQGRVRRQKTRQNASESHARNGHDPGFAVRRPRLRRGVRSLPTRPEVSQR